MICTMSKHAAEANGCSDAMMLDYRGYVAEATGANLFFVKDGDVHTPKPDCFLNGITRQTV
jgi:branched-chain amino acid aminotransferase